MIYECAVCKKKYRKLMMLLRHLSDNHKKKILFKKGSIFYNGRY